MQILIILLAAYLIGSVPFGVIAAKFCGVDIFKIGSGSIGATNVIRACGKKWGLIVLILDAFKGTAATWLGLGFLGNPWLVVVCALLAMLGHSHSIYIGFKGGKAAATGVGVVLALDWRIFLIIGFVTIFIRQISGYQSLASLIGSALASPLFIAFKHPVPYLLLAILGTLFVWYKHIPNIQRLLAGTESKITKVNKWQQ